MLKRGGGLIAYRVGILVLQYKIGFYFVCYGLGGRGGAKKIYKIIDKKFMDKPFFSHSLECKIINILRVAGAALQTVW